MTTFTGEIIRIERLRLSRNGNPRMRVSFAGTGRGETWRAGPTLTTGTDAAVGYEIENAEWRDGPVTVTLTRAGRIIGIRHATEDAPGYAE